jgi:hypothetical protein
VLCGVRPTRRFGGKWNGSCFYVRRASNIDSLPCVGDEQAFHTGSIVSLATCSHS